MASWILVPSLVSLRNEFTALAPERDKTSDGSIGDPAHASSSSDHNPDETGATPYEDSDRTNEVHAIDVDKDLNRPGWTMERAVQVIVREHKAGRDNRLQYVIFNRRIWSRSWSWTERVYDGPNPHDKHAHFSCRYTTAQESDTSPWGLLLEGEEVTENDIEKIADRVMAKLMDAASNGSAGLGFRLRGLPWQYPVDEGKSALAAFNELRQTAKDILAKITTPASK